MNSSSHRPDLPLTTEALILERVQLLIGEASRRQLWLLFLHEDRTMSEVIMPCEGLPDDADAVVQTDEGPLSHADALGRTLGHVAAEFGFTALVFVWERPGGPETAADERRWAQSLAAACDRRGLVVAGQYLAYDAGIRPLRPSEG